MGRVENFTLKFSTGEIGAAARKFEDYKKQMNEIQKELTETMNTLKTTDWRGKAADELYKVVGDQWSKDVQRYCDLLEKLTEIMSSVVTEYDALESHAKRVKLSV